MSMEDKMQFAGRVAVITGAGGGLGREYALALAKRGAMVVVNDLGGSSDGSGKGTRMADKVVKEIRDAGGKAVANYNSVEDGDKVIKTAIDNFGRVDILINNAGILRDKSMVKMTDDDWDLVHRVHLRGSFKMTKAAWKHFRQQKYGRIIMTSSNAGTQGNFGQANYSAAKMGLIGLAKSVAIEGAKYGIMCNTIIPIAGSRMTEAVMPGEYLDMLKAKYIAPVVLYLCHETCPTSGDMYMSAGGLVKKLRLQMSDGLQFLIYGDDFGPEHIKKHWTEIETFGTEEMPKDMNQILMEFTESARNAVSENGAGNKNTQKSNIAEEMMGKDLGLSKYEYTFKEPIMYALSVGATLSEGDTSNLKFLYEHDQDFSVLPTFGVIASMYGIGNGMVDTLSNAGYDPTRILHGEQYTEMFAPLPSEGKLKTKVKISDVLDKGKGLLILMDTETMNEKDELLVFNQTSIFVPGAGGFGGRRESTVEKKLVDPPTRKPDHIVEQVVPTSQAALYRLNQDENPLHIDPQIAQMAGFKTPILHGLCTYGYAARHILKTVAGNDVSKFRCMKARFSSPVLPGQTLATHMWVEGKRVHFEVLVKETDKKVITKAYVDLNDISTEKSSSEAPKEETTSGSGVEQVFSEVRSRLQKSPDLAKQFNAVLVYNITKDKKVQSTWVVDLKSTPPKIYKDQHSGKGDCTVTMPEDIFLAIAAGKANALKAYMDGNLKLEGNLAVAQKMNKLFSTESKL